MALFVVLRLASTLGIAPREFVDTKEYFIVDFWGGVRLPVVPLIYWLLHNRSLIVTVQTLAATVVWAAGIHSLSSVMRSQRMQVAFLACGYSLGLTRVVAHLDTALLSESLSATAAIALLALLARSESQRAESPRARAPRALDRGAQAQGAQATRACIAVGAFWGLTRQNNTLTLLVFAVILLGGAFVVRSRLWRRVGGALAAIAVVGLVLGSVNSQIRTTNTAQVLQRRIIGPGIHTMDGGRHEAWFAARGLPAQAHDLMAARAATSDFDRTAALLDDDEVRHWIETEGSTAYPRFLLSHPAYVVAALAEDGAPRRGFVTGSTDYGHSRTVLPQPIERLWWPDSSSAQSLLLVAAAGCIGIISTCARALRRFAVVGLFVAVSFANIAVVAHTAGADYGRLLLTSAVIARLGLVWIAFAVWDVSRPGTSSNA